MVEIQQEKKVRYVHKNQSLYKLVDKLKLWPSRKGILHGVKAIENKGEYIIVTTHCGEVFNVWNSKNSRSARWIRNRWTKYPCPKCKVPQWKLDKYTQTVFTNGR